MGKKGGTTTSWLTAVKRAFRSPSKHSPDNKTSRRKLDHHQEDEDEKVSFQYSFYIYIYIHTYILSVCVCVCIIHESWHEFLDQFVQKSSERRRWLFRKHSNNNPQLKETTTDCIAPKTPDQRHAIAVATAAAEAAVQIIRLTQPPPTSFNQHSAARVIQKAFRGYLVRNNIYIYISICSNY